MNIAVTLLIILVTHGGYWLATGHVMTIFSSFVVGVAAGAIGVMFGRRP